MPLSAVAVERAIALMRDIEAYKRNRMQEPQWQAENLIRYNTWVMDIDFDTARAGIMKMQAAIDSPGHSHRRRCGRRCRCSRRRRRWLSWWLATPLPLIEATVSTANSIEQY